MKKLQKKIILINNWPIQKECKIKLIVRTIYKKLACA